MTDDRNLRNNNQYIDCPPKFVTNAEYLEILNELIQREPIFHHPEFGTTQQDFENMTDKNSGKLEPLVAFIVESMYWH
jgi:hypothetical protein